MLRVCTPDQTEATAVMTWNLYVVECSDGTLYTGITTDLTRRVRQHNGEIKGGAKYTRPRRPVTLVAHWPQENRSVASKAEWAFKQLQRTQKLQEISAWVITQSKD
jgi:putative endonuclease